MFIVLAWCSKDQSNTSSSATNDIHPAYDKYWANWWLQKINDHQPNDLSQEAISKQITKMTVLEDLAKKWAWMISECEYKSDLYFSVDFNNLKLPTKIVDSRWEIYATCDYDVESWYKLTPICDDLQNCKLVYVAKNNLRWYNPVDKYSIDLKISNNP